MSFLNKMFEIKKSEAKNYVKPIKEIKPKKISYEEGKVIIAEVKKASPSKGVISKTIDAIEQAQRYKRGGATAISVLTESEYFLGSYNDLYSVASNVALPVLCKDFIFFSHQIKKARDYGASIILLIAAGLEKNQLLELEQEAFELDMSVLLEIHDEQDLEKIMDCQSDLIGVNNRNLQTLEVNLETSERLLPLVQKENRFPITESGILCLNDASRLSRAGAKGFLIGEALMRCKDPEKFLKELRQL